MKRKNDLTTLKGVSVCVTFEKGVRHARYLMLRGLSEKAT